MQSPGSSCVERQRRDMSPLILATIALTSLMVTIGRGGLSINGSLLMTYSLRPVVALALGLLVTACGGGGSVVPTLPPDAPGSFTAELTPNHEAFLSWTAPTPSADRAPVTVYAVYLETSGGENRKLGETGSLSYLHPGLSPGTRYVFHVRALSAVGPSQASESAFVDVPLAPSLLPPEAPGSFEAVLTPNNEALLTWEAPTPAPNRAPVTGYEAYLESPGGQPRRLGETDSLSYLHSGLLPGRSYVFHVRALSDRGPSPPSNSSAVDVPGGPVVPLAVPHVTVRADEGGGRAVISWIHRLIPEVSTVVRGFALQYCEVVPTHLTDHCDHPDGWRPVQPDEQNNDLHFPPTTRSFTDDEFPPCNRRHTTVAGARMYRVRALADNPSASSRWSVPTRPICPSEDYSPPRRVDAVFAADSVENRVNICWEAPEPNGSDVTGYELQITPDENLPVTEDGWLIVDAHVDPDGGALPVCRLYSGLAEDDERWFRVRAYNLAGHGHWSAPYHYIHDYSSVPPLSNSSGAQNQSTLTVADARAREGEDAALVFEVNLDRATSAPVMVDYATADGTAKAGEDYRTEPRGRSSSAAGETSKTVEVAVLDDTKDEGEETFTLRLSNASGARYRGRRGDGGDRERRFDAEGVAHALRADHCRSGGGRGGGAARRDAGLARHGGRHVARVLGGAGGSGCTEPARARSPGGTCGPSAPRSRGASRHGSSCSGARFISPRRATGRPSRRGGVLRRGASRPTWTMCERTAR